MTLSIQLTAPAPDAGADSTYPTASRAWYAVFIFYVAYTLAFVDRQIMAFLVGPIRADFHLSDFQFSLIHGLAFVLFYSTLGIPIARLADVHNRRNIIAIGIAIWSVMTGLCGLAGSYSQLFLARLGVGVGEATLSPAAISIISDVFPPHRRALPIGIYSAGVHGGAGLASVFGGLVVGYAMSHGSHPIAGLGNMRPWQFALLIVGLPGLLVSAASLTVREPARHERAADGRHLRFSSVLRYLNEHRLLYATLMVGAALAALASYGAFSWVPALYARRFGWTPARTGASFGLITLVFGTGGLLLSGFVAERMAAAGRSAPYSKVMIVTMGAAAVPAALLLAVPNPYWTLGCLALLVGFMSTPIGLAQTALQAVTPNEMRAQVIAVYLLTVAFVGSAAGPTSVALLTDFYFHDDAAVGSSIALVATGAAVASSVILLLGLRAYSRKEAQAGVATRASREGTVNA